MTATDLFNEVRHYCQCNSDEAIVRKYSRYFKDEYDAYGVSAELFQAKLKELLGRPEMTLELVLETARLLIPQKKYEEVSFGLGLTQGFKKQFNMDVFREIEHWYQLGITNWAHTDMICGELLPLFLDQGLVSLSAFESWRVADNRFQRRSVPVTFIKPFKKGRELAPLLDFIDPLMMDPERVVHQGLGWFLREAWKKQPAPVEVFLHKWKNDAARLIFQYATEKMTKEYRVQFRKEKGKK
ncbi:DNA alkylation repair protein [Marinilabiliaceae bacterium JC017]|nr:DNA alkylation repair protein [Marinilabiliaceae bacterium JC017]